MSALEGSVFQEQGMRAGIIKPPLNRQLEVIYDEFVYIVTEEGPWGLNRLWAFSKESTAEELVETMRKTSDYAFSVHRVTVVRK